MGSGPGILESKVPRALSLPTAGLLPIAKSLYLGSVMGGACNSPSPSLG